MNTTGRIEKYELKISKLIREIQTIQGMIQRKEGISSFSRSHPEKIDEAVAKMTEAQKVLYDSIGLLLESGNSKKTRYLEPNNEP